MPSSDIPLAIGYWLVSHKPTLKRWWAIVLLLTMFVSSIWTVTAVALATIQSPKLVTRIHETATRLKIFSPTTLGTPMALTVRDLTVIRRSAAKADVVAFLANTNTDWGAVKVQYSFSLGTTSTPVQTIWVNPGEIQPIMAQNVTLAEDVDPSVAQTVVEWGRMTSRTMQPSFTIEAQTIEPARVTLQGSTIETITVSASAKNESVYNFYHVRVPVVVRSGDRVVAVDELTIDGWKSREVKRISASWTYPITSASTVKVTPTVGVFDTANRF